MITRSWGLVMLLCNLVLTGSLQSEESAPVIFRGLNGSDSSKVLIAAHRGGYENDVADAAPENSLANIRNSQKKGFELYETDIQRTKDGHFIIVHDPTIDRETTGSGKVSEMTLDELRALRKRYRDGTISQERIATLEEFLKEGEGRTVFKADLKPGVKEHFAAIMELVSEHDAEGGIFFRVPYWDADFFDDYNKEWGPMPRHMWMFRVKSKKQIDDIKERFDSSTISIISDKDDPSKENTVELIRHARDRGFIVEAHAVGSEEDWSKLVNSGVSIFHATAPSRVREFLNSLPPTE